MARASIQGMGSKSPFTRDAHAQHCQLRGSLVLLEELQLEPESGNVYDQYALGVMKGTVLVGRVPRELSQAFWLFLSSGGSITCEVTGGRRKGRGLEVPCTYRATAGSKDILKKLKRSLANL